MTGGKLPSITAAGIGENLTRHATGSNALSVLEHRELFWQNVMREILNSLSVAAASASGRLTASAKGAANSGKPVGELFDGRLAVITALGNRVAIADIFPLFACSVAGGNAASRELSTDVQCTVYQIRTPEGEVHTLPIHEIRSFHSLSPDLIERLKQAARAQQAATGKPDMGENTPFGFAAFTSTARQTGATGAEGSDQGSAAAGEATQPDTGPETSPATNPGPGPTAPANPPGV